MPEVLTRLQLALADRYRIDSEIRAGGMATVCLDVSPDDKRFVFVRASTGGGGTELVVVEHWFDELKGRVGR